MIFCAWANSRKLRPQSRFAPAHRWIRRDAAQPCDGRFSNFPPRPSLLASLFPAARDPAAARPLSHLPRSALSPFSLVLPRPSSSQRPLSLFSCPRPLPRHFQQPVIQPRLSSSQRPLSLFSRPLPLPCFLHPRQLHPSTFSSPSSSCAHLPRSALSPFSLVPVLSPPAPFQHCRLSSLTAPHSGLPTPLCLPSRALAGFGVSLYLCPSPLLSGPLLSGLSQRSHFPTPPLLSQRAYGKDAVFSFSDGDFYLLCFVCSMHTFERKREKLKAAISIQANIPITDDHLGRRSWVCDY